MSSEIRAGDRRTYWIVSNGNGYVDGVTDPGLVTTVGNGMHVYWMGTDFQEYSEACVKVGIVPRNSDPNIPTTSDRPIVLEPFMIINNLSQKLDEISEQKEKIDKIEEISNNIAQIDSTVSNIMQSQEQITGEINTTVSDIATKQEETIAKLDTLGFVVPGVRISARQARLWLIQNGVDLNNINTAIDGIEDPIIRESVRVEWEYATYVERSYPWLGALASQLGFSEEDLDRAFQEGPLI